MDRKNGVISACARDFKYTHVYVCVCVCALVSFAINANGAIGEGVVRGVDLESVARGIELAIELFALIICW